MWNFQSINSEKVDFIPEAIATLHYLWALFLSPSEYVEWEKLYLLFITFQDIKCQTIWKYFANVNHFTNDVCNLMPIRCYLNSYRINLCAGIKKPNYIYWMLIIHCFTFNITKQITENKVGLEMSHESLTSHSHPYYQLYKKDGGTHCVNTGCLRDNPPP